MTRNFRLNSQSAIKEKWLLFKVVKTNWIHNNKPFRVDVLENNNMNYLCIGDLRLRPGSNVELYIFRT